MVDGPPKTRPRTSDLARGDSSPLQSERNSPSPPYGEDPYIEHLGKFPFSQEFVTTFLSMPPKSKHAFETGRILEDIIFHSVRFAPPDSKWIKNNPILHWILDLKCDDVKKWFSKAERAEIMSMGPPLPPRDAGFEFAVERFPKVPESFEQLLDITESLTRPAGTPYVRATHCNATYSNHAAIAILRVIESYNSCSWLGPQDLREGWFTNIWQPLVDHCLHSIPSFAIFRTDIKSSSSVDNNYRFDGILRAKLQNSTVYELGCIEVARVPKATAATKGETDTSKLISGLHDMLGVLERSVDSGEETMKSLQVVGIQNIGFQVNMWTMHKVGKHVALLQKGQVRSVPMEWKDFKQAIHVMRAVVMVKLILERNITAVRDWESRREDSGDVL
ncbi:hypothetical protein Q9L58_009320 [Maublancomyces gigas]|uniref:Uncharacterized protein n=1 Tax=Discina gigas TaxID=1032678 RepID=A0ABR3G7R2_9PEZI